ncbi:MAG: helicase C-terminal domain-containing protein, partial [Candidatus Odinarchaeota archaeon]
MSKTKPINYYLDMFKDYFPHISEIYDVQEKMALKMLNALKNDGTVITCQGPTGMGKSLVIDAVAMKIADEGKRVLISSPVYSALNDNHHIQLESLKVDHGILHGFSWWKRQGFRCPKDNSVLPSKNVCIKSKCSEESCPVYQEYQDIRAKNLVLTVHHKIASTPSIIKDEKFDVVIIDESHNLPQIIENLAFQRFSTDSLAAKLATSSPRAQKIIKRARTGEVKEVDKRKILRELRKLAEIPEADEDTYFLAQAQRVDFSNGKWTFYRPPRRQAKLPEKLSAALVSATMEKAPDHIKDCQFDSLSQAPPFNSPLTDRFRRRFQRRPVFYLSDGPILRKDRDSPDTYNDFRQEANKLIQDLALVVKDQVTLILCRSNADAQSIHSHLQTNTTLKGQITYLGDEDDRDTDEIESYCKNEIDKGKKLIIATAKNGLWEGANIPELRCVIIDSLPYRAPNPTEETIKAKGGFYRSSMFRFMLRRLQQGIGRLVRKDGDWGIAIIIDGRMYSGKRWIHKQLPQWIVDPGII